MKNIIALAAAVILLGAGCTGGPSGTSAPTPPPVNPPTPPVSTSPVVTPVSSTPTSTAPATVGQIKIFFIALDDQNKTSPKIGCGDSVQPVLITIPPTTAPLTAALRELLAVHDQYYGMSGLYNALYQSRLKLASASVVGGKATVKLTGTMELGGACDNPRFEAQLLETVKQFSTVKSVEVFINGKKMEDLLSGRG